MGLSCESVATKETHMAPVDEGERRVQILDAATAVIARRGVDSARLADIAEEAGVSLGLVQHYFRKREKLLADVFRSESERIASSWRVAVDPTAPPLDRLIEYLRLCSPGSGAAARSFGPGWAFWLQMWSKANRDVELQPDVQAVYQSFAEPFTKAIEEGVEKRVFRPRSDVANVVDRMISLIDGLAVRSITGTLPQDRMLELLVESLTLELNLTPKVAAQAQELAAQQSRPARVR
jgi:AcrR family transcriptional regulator